MSALAVWMGTVMRFWRKSLDCLHLLCVGFVLKAASEHTHTGILPVEMKPINASTQWMPKYFTPIMQVCLNLQNLLWHHKVLFLIYRDQMPSYLLSTASPQLLEVPPILPHLPILFRAYYQPSLTGADQGKNSSKIYRDCVLQKLWSVGRMMLSRKLMFYLQILKDWQACSSVLLWWRGFAASMSSLLIWPHVTGERRRFAPEKPSWNRCCSAPVPRWWFGQRRRQRGGRPLSLSSQVSSRVFSRNYSFVST